MAEEVEVRFSYTWIIKNFNDIVKKKEWQKSHSFFTDFEKNFEWEIQIAFEETCKERCRTCGAKCARAQQISLFLKSVNVKEASPNLKIDFSVSNTENGKMFSKSVVALNVFRGQRFGFYNFIVLEDLLKLMIGSSVTIVCEVKKLKESETESGSIFETFIDDTSLCDVALVVGSRTFQAHKVILAANSPVFRRMFSHRMKEVLTNVVEIEDMDPGEFEELLRYIYTRNIMNLRRLADRLLVAANRYEVTGLHLICERFLKTDLNVGNVIDCLMLADDHNASSLKAACFSWIFENFKTVIRLEGFKALEKSHSNLLVELCVRMDEEYNFTFEKIAEE